MKQTRRDVPFKANACTFHIGRGDIFFLSRYSWRILYIIMESGSCPPWKLLTAGVFLLSFFKVYLTADESQLVTGLPGQPDGIKFKQYAGQITINKTSGKAFFYWFYEADSAKASESLPVVLWLNGGPGCSSVGAGALSELGPFQPDDSGKLALNPYSWSKAANVIFLESPVGVGFSYSRTRSDYDSLDDEGTARDNLSFLVEWFAKFPEYSKNEFYVTGESYAGHYIPTLASHILAYNSRGGSINFKGFAIGNPWTTPFDDAGNVEFLYSHSLVSEEAYTAAMNSCFSSKPDNSKCNRALELINEMTYYVDPYNVYKEACNSDTSLNKTFMLLRSQPAGRLRILQKVYDPCDDPVPAYLNKKEVQAALHVENRPVQWSVCSQYDYSSEDIDKSVVPLYTELVKSGIRIWIYSGDFDSVVSTVSTRNWLKQLNFTVDTAWYAWDLNSQVGGWSQVYKGLTFTSIRGAGHMVPSDQPAAALTMFQSFLDGKPLPTF